MSAFDQKYTELTILGRGNVYILALNNQHPDQQPVVKSELMSLDTQDSSVGRLLQRHQIQTGHRNHFDLCRLGKTGHDILNQLATKVAGVARTATVLDWVLRTAGFSAGTRPMIGKFSP